ncbi:hypothetical protein BBD42_13070 [Paenibacillus sp. BIHB 4019]|uniref:Uncharacterized protein n=1 Tax=Paenibacillus sp. BIHB 4019 TaxID=1870819 RepID=A0A1B2DHV8_9BACL|nr:hypothetical protein [Paenibacillus sp. BIHB 4019]ANY67302.1 hypothetical protein BBD42_13070 [Paenibacillus sp. BIHB 4019]
MENLQNELTELQTKEATLSAEWEQINSEPNVNVSRFNEVSSQLNTVRDQIKEKQGEIERQRGTQFDNISVGGYPFTLRELCASEDDYRILSGWLQGYVGDMSSAHEAVVSSLHSEVAALKSDVSEMEAVRSNNFDLELRCKDIESKRDAAAAELEAAQEELKRLNADNNALRMQIESVNKPVSTNLTGDLEERAKKRHNAKPGIYNKRWVDEIRQTHYVATLLETGEEITFGYLEAGKYREVTAEEVERFRAEEETKRLEAEAAAVAVEEAVPDSPLVDYPKPPALPSDGLEVDEHAAVPTGDGTDFETEVKRRLAMLELHVFGRSEVA